MEVQGPCSHQYCTMTGHFPAVHDCRTSQVAVPLTGCRTSIAFPFLLWSLYVVNSKHLQLLLSGYSPPSPCEAPELQLPYDRRFQHVELPFLIAPLSPTSSHKVVTQTNSRATERDLLKMLNEVMPLHPEAAVRGGTRIAHRRGHLSMYGKGEVRMTRKINTNTALD